MENVVLCKWEKCGFPGMLLRFRLRQGKERFLGKDCNKARKRFFASKCVKILRKAMGKWENAHYKVRKYLSQLNSNLKKESCGKMSRPIQRWWNWGLSPIS